jgi:hypothetical protein
MVSESAKMRTMEDFSKAMRRDLLNVAKETEVAAATHQMRAR